MGVIDFGVWLIFLKNFVVLDLVGWREFGWF